MQVEKIKAKGKEVLSSQDPKIISIFIEDEASVEITENLARFITARYFFSVSVQSFEYEWLDKDQDPIDYIPGICISFRKDHLKDILEALIIDIIDILNIKNNSIWGIIFASELIFKLNAFWVAMGNDPYDLSQIEDILGKPLFLEYAYKTMIYFFDGDFEKPGLILSDLVLIDPSTEDNLKILDTFFDSEVTA